MMFLLVMFSLLFRVLPVFVYPCTCALFFCMECACATLLRSATFVSLLHYTPRGHRIRRRGRVKKRRRDDEDHSEPEAQVALRQELEVFKEIFRHVVRQHMDARHAPVLVTKETLHCS